MSGLIRRYGDTIINLSNAYCIRKHKSFSGSSWVIEITSSCWNRFVTCKNERDADATLEEMQRDLEEFYKCSDPHH